MSLSKWAFPPETHKDGTSKTSKTPTNDVLPVLRVAKPRTSGENEWQKQPEPALGNDPIVQFKREYRRLSKRISRVMDSDLDRGYLAWARQHNPELWRSLENARGAWDVNERLEELKAGRIVWRDYRALMLAWARYNIMAIRLHRLALKERKAP